MALQGNVSEVSNKVVLSNGQEIRAVAIRNGTGHTEKRVLVSGKGGARVVVTNQDCRDMNELLDWLQKA